MCYVELKGKYQTHNNSKSCLITSEL